MVKQQAEQVEDLRHTLMIIRKLSVKNDSIPSQIIQMYLLNEGELGFMQPCKVWNKGGTKLINYILFTLHVVS